MRSDGTTRTVADLVARTLGLREEGLSAWCYTGSYQVPVQTLTGTVRGLPIRRIASVRDLASRRHLDFTPRASILDEMLNADPLGEVTIRVPDDIVDALATVLEVTIGG